MVHQVNRIPILHLPITKRIMHLINPPNKSNLYWSWFFGSIIVLTNLTSGVFMSWLSLLASYSLDNNQKLKYLEQKKATWPILFHLWISLYHACFNDSHTLIWRQDQHYTRAIQNQASNLWKNLSINNFWCLHNQTHKTTNVMSTQKGGRGNVKHKKQMRTSSGLILNSTTPSKTLIMSLSIMHGWDKENEKLSILSFTHTSPLEISFLP